MTVNRERHRRSKWSEGLFRRILARIEKGTLTCDAIRREGITTTTFYRHLAKSKEKSEALTSAQLLGPIRLAEQAVFDRGVNGWEEPVFQQGKEVGRVQKFSDPCLLAYLRANHPRGIYRESAQVSVSNHVQVNSVELSKALNSTTESERAAHDFFSARTPVKSVQCPEREGSPK